MNTKYLTPAERGQNRLRNHLLLALLCLALTALIDGILLQVNPSPQAWISRWSMATGYVGIGLLGVTLSIGTINILSGRRNPISSDLRRDAGIWCAIFAVVHTFIGLNVHMQSWKQYFLSDAGGLRVDLFGLANYAGAAAICVVAVLLITSNDYSLLLLKSQRWKSLQRWNYFFAFLIVFHGLIYIALENRIVPFVFILGTIALWMLIVQTIGFFKRRHQMISKSARQIAQI